MASWASLQPGEGNTPDHGGHPDSRRGHWGIWIFAFCATTCFSAWAGLKTTPGELPEVWIVATVAFTWLSMNWYGEGLLPTPDRYLTLTLVSLAGMGVLTGVLMDASWFAIICSAIGIPLQAMIMASVTLAMRRLLRLPAHPSIPGSSVWRDRWVRTWGPVDAIDLLALVVGALVSALFSLAIGSFPGLTFFALTPLEVVQWITHVMVISVVGGVLTLIIFATFSKEDLRQPWAQVIGTWLASVALLGWVHSTGAVTMAWLQVIPTLIIAMTCRLWVTALFSLSLGALSVIFSPRLNAIEANPGPIPLGTVMDLMVATLIMVALTMAFLTRRREALLADLDVERGRTTRHLTVMQTVFEAMHEGVVVVGDDLALRFHNSAAIDLLGRPFPQQRNDDWSSHFGLTTLTGQPVRDLDLRHNEYLVLDAPGGRRILHQRTLRLSDLADDGLMVVLADVTEQHERLDELSGFAGVVAHDLRAPLTSLEGWLELASEAVEDADDQQVGPLLTRARASNRRMRQIIDDWLNYTVDRQGALEISDFPLAAPVNVVMSNLAETGPHRFSVEVPHTVRADLATLRQVLANLIGNASKFSRPDQTPQIAIRSHLMEDGWVRVDVEDRGIGLPAGQEEAIFEEYQRGTGPATQVEGFGLGLALCRRVVERHGGTIWARTNSHGGATVSFTLPAA